MHVDDLKMSRFLPLLASEFDIAAPADPAATPAGIRARLERVTPGTPAAGYEQYAMLFLGPVQPLLPQGTYRFHHDQLGELPLFMVPVGQDANGTQYEVCVARKLD